jgi:hypothetical protein
MKGPNPNKHPRRSSQTKNMRLDIKQSNLEDIKRPSISIRTNSSTMKLQTCWTHPSSRSLLTSHSCKKVSQVKAQASTMIRLSRTSLRNSTLARWIIMLWLFCQIRLQAAYLIRMAAVITPAARLQRALKLPVSCSNNSVWIILPALLCTTQQSRVVFKRCR